MLGPAGLAALLLATIARGVVVLGEAPRARLPNAVGSRRLSFDRGLRARVAVTLGLAVAVPTLALIAVLILIDEGWLVVASGLLFGVAGLVFERAAHRRRVENRPRPAREATLALQRLSMQADLPPPVLTVEPSRVPTAWTHRERLHVTTALLEALDGAEVEAVLAHELAHVARRDAAVMEVASAPSRLLLAAVATFLHPKRLPEAAPHQRLAVRLMGLLYIPPAFLLGWASRLLVLNLSRARELGADAGAVALTGQPSALASALLKLGGDERAIPREDLRAAEARGVLCIVEVRASRLHPLMHTHPPVAERVERLEAMERRLQAPP